MKGVLAFEKVPSSEQSLLQSIEEIYQITKQSPYFKKALMYFISSYFSSYNKHLIMIKYFFE